LQDAIIESDVPLELDQPVNKTPDQNHSAKRRVTAPTTQHNAEWSAKPLIRATRHNAEWNDMPVDNSATTRHFAESFIGREEDRKDRKDIYINPLPFNPSSAGARANDPPPEPDPGGTDQTEALDAKLAD